jgi:hypothetical protein
MKENLRKLGKAFQLDLYRTRAFKRFPVGWEKEVESYFKKEPYELHTYTYKAMPLTDRGKPIQQEVDDILLIRFMTQNGLECCPSSLL